MPRNSYQEFKGDMGKGCGCMIVLFVIGVAVVGVTLLAMIAA